jgi:hypothetical protein
MTARPPWAPPDGVSIPRNIIEAIDHPQWWGPWFAHGDWGAWRAFLAALFGLPLDDASLSIYRECTGRAELPTASAREVWAVVGRRGGKSRVMATVAAWLSAFLDWRPYLAPGERAAILLIAADRKQARVVLRYLRSLLVQHPLLKQLVTRDTGEIIELSCGASIEITTASFRTTRGYSVAAVICDELAFWHDDTSTNPATEIIAALRPAMATMPGSLLMAVSSPHARRGPLWESYRKHYGKDGDPILIWKAPTRVMNPTVPQEIIDEAMELDPARAQAEYGAEFRVDVETFIGREVVDAVIVPGRHELPRVPGMSYFGFVDPSGGSSDSMTIAIAHLDRASNCVVLDAVRERLPPFSPDAVVNEFTGLLQSYGVHKVTGDRYAGEWPREAFRKLGIAYEPSERTKSEIYGELLPLLNAGRVELLDHARLVSQLCALERRTARSGRDSIDHPPQMHDDVANAVAGALVLAQAVAPFMSSEAMARLVALSYRERAMRERRAFH